MRLVCLAACAAVLLVGPALAQPQAPAPGVLDQVYACASVTDERERLACYDGAVGRLQQAQRSGELVAVDRVQAQELERDSFGFSLASIARLFNRPITEGAAPEPSVAELQLQIERITSSQPGRATFHMSNGQVWTQVDTVNTSRARRGGNVTIRRAALGSYLMDVEAGGPPVRVRRQE